MVKMLNFMLGVCAVLSPSVTSDSETLGSSIHGDSPGKNTGVGCHALLQGIFPTQGSNPGSLALQADSLLSEPPGIYHNKNIEKNI